jgi:hypothetical protein
VPGKYVPHFKPGRLLRERVNQHSSMSPNDVSSGHDN